MAEWDHRTRTGWRDWAEWVHVYQSLFFPDSLTLAIDPIETMMHWRSKSTVPHAVASTLDFFLLLRQLGAASSAMDAHVVRLALSSAIVRFVNGACDPLLSMRSTASVLNAAVDGDPVGGGDEEGDGARRETAGTSILALSKRLGLPSFLVTLRHACTHSTLPTLDSLVLGAHHALDWCRVRYWQSQYALLVKENVVRENEGGRVVPVARVAVLLDKEDVAALNNRKWVSIKKWNPCPVGAVVQLDDLEAVSAFNDSTAAEPLASPGREIATEDAPAPKRKLVLRKLV